MCGVTIRFCFQATRSTITAMRDQEEYFVCARIRFQPVIELLSFPRRIDFCLRRSVFRTMSLDRQHQQKRSLLTSASRTHSIDLVSLAVCSLKLGDVKSSKESLQVERDDVMERNDTIEERKCRLREKSRDEPRTINLVEVAWHDTPGDCWLVIYDYVYDCTEFLKSHPGGQDVLLEYAGRDATLAFIGTGHSSVATTILERYKIGELPSKERIFRTSNGLKVSGF